MFVTFYYSVSYGKHKNFGERCRTIKYVRLADSVRFESSSVIEDCSRLENNSLCSSS